MKQKNLILRYFGLIVLSIGIILNFRMFLSQAWPTYLFFIVCLIGIIQLIISFVLKKMNIFWQVFLILIPFVLGFVILN